MTFAGTVTSVSAYSSASTVVTFITPALTLASGVTEAIKTCRVFRTADPNRAGPTFYLTYYDASSSYIVDQAMVEEKAIGNQFGGLTVRVEVANLAISSVSELSVAFGSAPLNGNSVSLGSSTANSIVLYITSPSISSADYSTISSADYKQTVSLSLELDPSKSTSFEFTYVWVSTPRILSVNPASAATTSGETLTLELTDTSLLAQASDITVVFQGSIELPCSQLLSDAANWICMVSLPDGLTATTGSSADPNGLQVYTAQQGSSNKASAAFLYLSQNTPVYTTHFPTVGKISNQFTDVSFDNYCIEHDVSGYTVSCTTPNGTQAATVNSPVAFTSNTDSTSCTTTLNIELPTVSGAFDSTCTAEINNDQTFDFVFAFVTDLRVQSSSLSSTIIDSSPEILFTLINVRSANSSTLCDGSSCETDHDIVVTFGTEVATLVQGPTTCNDGECNIMVQAPVLTTPGTTTVTVTADSDTATFSLSVWDYDCTSYCADFEMILSANLVASEPPSTSVCLTKYCIFPVFRNPLISSISNPSLNGLAECNYNEECVIRMRASDITSEVLDATTLSTQISVAFGASRIPPVSVVLVLQDDNVVEFDVTTPIVSASMAGLKHDVYVTGYDESGLALEASSIDGFKFKNVATGDIAFASGSPLTGMASGEVTVSTLVVSNVPDDVQKADVVVEIGGNVATVTDFSVDQAFVAKITVTVPEYTCDDSCTVSAEVSIPSRSLETNPGFNFTYFANRPPVIASFFPVSGSTDGTQEVVFQVSNLATDASTGNYQYAASSITADFGGTTVTASSTAAGNADGVVAVTVIAPAADSAGLQSVTLVVTDDQFTDETVLAPENFEYYGTTPYIQSTSPQTASAGGNFNMIASLLSAWSFDVYVGNHALDSTTTYSVALCSQSIVATAVSKDSNSIKLTFSSYGCPGTQTFSITTADSALEVDGEIVFSQPAVQLSVLGVSVAGYDASVAVFGLPEVTAPDELRVQLGDAPVQTLTPTSISVDSFATAAAADGWTIFTVAIPATAAAGLVSGTIGLASASVDDDQSWSIRYKAAPGIQNINPASGYTTANTIVSFNLNDFAVTETTGLTGLKCTADGVEVDTTSLVITSYGERTSSASIQMPRSADAKEVSMRCINREYPEAGAVTFAYSYTMPPAAMTFNVSEGTHLGGTTILVDIANMYNPSFTDSTALADLLAVLTMTFTGPSGIAAYVTSDIAVVYSQPSTITSAAVTRFSIVTPPAPNGPGEVEVILAASTQSVFSSFLYIDTTIAASSLTGISDTSLACALNSCVAAASGGSVVEVTIANFPLARQGDVSVKYGAMIGTAISLTQTGTNTVMQIAFSSACDAGVKRVEISPSSQSTTTVFIYVEFEASTAATQVLFSDSIASAVKITFNNDIVWSDPCPPPSAVFENATIAFGLDEGHCDRNNYYASMQHAAGTTAMVGTSLTLIGGLQPASAISTTSPQTFLIQQPPSTVAPVARITGPQEVDLCESSMMLKGGSSTGAGWRRYSWTSPTSTALNTELQANAATRETIQVDGTYLAAGATLEVCLEVTDVFEAVSLQLCHSISRAALPVPTVQVVGSSASLVLETEAQNTLEGLATFSACVGRQDVHYLWTLPDSICGSVEGCALDMGLILNSRYLIIPPGTLSAGLNVEITLQAWTTESPANVGKTVTSLQTTYPELQCQISGGSGQRSTTSELVLDASASADPAGDAFTISWICATSAGGDCRSATGALVEAAATATTGITTVAADTMILDTYVWTAEVRGTQQRWKTCQTSYTMVAGTVLTLEMSIPEAGNIKDKQREPGTWNGVDFDFLANEDDETKIECKTTVPTGSADYDLAFANPAGDMAGFAGLTTLTSETVNGDSTTISMLLIVTAGTFSSGVISEIQCVDGASQGYSSLMVLGNDRPGSGSCTITPDQGNSVTEEFTVSCKEFADSMDVQFWNDNQLSYEFVLVDNAGEETALSGESKDAELNFNVATAGEYTIVAKISDSLGNPKTKTVAVTVLDQTVTTDDLQNMVDSTMADALATGNAGTVARKCMTVGRALGAASRRTSETVTTASLQSLDTSAQGVIASEPDAKVILQSLSDLIHTPAANAQLFDADVALSISILERAVEGMQSLTVPTISTGSGDLIVSLLDDLSKAAVISSSATKISIQSSSEKVRKGMGQLTALALSVGQSRSYGSGCIAIMYKQVDQSTPAATHTMTTGTCGTFTIPDASLPAAGASGNQLIEVGGVSPYITSSPGTPLGNFISTQMFSVTFYNLESTVATVASSSGLTAPNQIVIANDVSDARNCLGVSLVSNTVTWISTDVQCSAAGVNDNSQTAVAGKLELTASGTGTFAAVQALNTANPPTAAPTANPPTAAPTPRPTAAGDTTTILTYAIGGLAVDDFDSSTTKGQAIRNSAIESFASTTSTDATTVSIGQVSAYSRRSGVNIEFIITGSGSVDIVAVNAIMADAGVSGFAQAFTASALEDGYTVTVTSVTYVSHTVNGVSVTLVTTDGGGSDDVPVWGWILIGLAGAIFVAALVVAAVMHKRGDSAARAQSTRLSNDDQLEAGLSRPLYKDGEELGVQPTTHDDITLEEGNQPRSSFTSAPSPSTPTHAEWASQQAAGHSPMALAPGDISLAMKGDQPGVSAAGNEDITYRRHAVA